MAVNINRAISNFQVLINDIGVVVEDSLQVAALDGFALVERRLIETGKDKNGKAFEPYSDAYQKRKKKAGRDVGFRNFKFSGNMFGSAGIVTKEVETGQVKVAMGFRGEDETKKAGYNNEMSPGFLDMATEEIAIIEEDFNAGVLEKINDILNE